MVATCIRAVALSTALAIQTITRIIQSAYGTSDLEVELCSWTSPSYRKQHSVYPGGPCYHKLDTISGFKFKLLFFFHSIEDHPSCIFDAIYVYDGFNTAYRLLGTVCGNTTATFHSTGVYMTVRFKSDSSISSSGFRADYRVVGALQWL